MNTITLRSHQETTVKRMAQHSKGQVIVPTGGGKTMCMIEDLKREIKQADYRRNFVVVAPRILLAQQLCEEFLEQINNVNVLHVHSGETHHTHHNFFLLSSFFVNNRICSHNILSGRFI